MQNVYMCLDESNVTPTPTPTKQNKTKNKHTQKHCPLCQAHSKLSFKIRCDVFGFAVFLYKWLDSHLQNYMDGIEAVIWLLPGTWWRHQLEPFPRYWPFVWGIHRSTVNSSHKGRRRRALMFSLICAWIHGWVNNREADDLRRHSTHYDVTVMAENWWIWVNTSHTSTKNSYHNNKNEQNIISISSMYIA